MTAIDMEVVPISLPNFPDLISVDTRICSNSPNAIESTDKLCKQTVSHYSEADSFSCGCKADAADNFTARDADLIVYLVTVAGAWLCALLCLALFWGLNMLEKTCS